MLLGQAMTVSPCSLGGGHLLILPNIELFKSPITAVRIFISFKMLSLTLKRTLNVYLSECETGYVSCSSGRCLPQSVFCDGIDDCGDFSDEGERHCGEFTYSTCQW